MIRRTMGLLALNAALWATPSAAAEVRFQTERAYLYEENVERDLYTVVLHGTAIVNVDGSPIEVEAVEISALKQGTPISSLRVDKAEMNASASKLSKLATAGALARYEFVLRLDDYVPDLAPAHSTEVFERQMLLLRNKAILVSDKVDAIRVRTIGTDGSCVAEGILPVTDFSPANSYRFPLDGTWAVSPGPDLDGHHRWIASTEFALDIVRYGQSGSSGEVSSARLDDFYGYGAPVLAAADGVIVASENSATENSDALRQPNESWEDYWPRVAAMQAKLTSARPISAAGNYVTIQHANGEYTHYAHLAAGSVTVKVGDLVKQGEVIGALGHSGNSTEPHLHFQLMDGPEPFASRSLPLRFDDLEVYEIGKTKAQPKTGWIVNGG